MYVIPVLKKGKAHQIDMNFIDATIAHIQTRLATMFDFVHENALSSLIDRPIEKVKGHLWG